MKSFNYTVKDEVGIHARPAGLLVKEVKKYASKVTITKDGKSADASKLMAVMSLGVKCGLEGYLLWQQADGIWGNEGEGNAAIYWKICIQGDCNGISPVIRGTGRAGFGMDYLR